jgi:hypothetical protein
LPLLTVLILGAAGGFLGWRSQGTQRRWPFIRSKPPAGMTHELYEMWYPPPSWRQRLAVTVLGGTAGILVGVMLVQILS